MDSPDALTAEELAALVLRVFRPGSSDRGIAVLADLPDDKAADEVLWRERRRIAAEWAEMMHALPLGLPSRLFLYRNVGMNNADLPDSAWRFQGGVPPSCADELDGEQAVSFDEIFRTSSIFFALTQFSATAPLKLAAREHGFRAATMPGFNPAMIPALRLDYEEIDRRAHHLKELLDRAQEAELEFVVEGREVDLRLDLRYREAHASSGLLTEPGTAGNLPSGETYIVPYEGERPGDPSRSAGTLPVELADEVVFFSIAENRAVGVEGDGVEARRQADYLRREPAYGNLAELGLGLLADFGVHPIGEILLDEKLGLHIAFGRSDHFGGQVGAAQFSRPEAVVHIDRIFIPETQPRVRVRRVDLRMAKGLAMPLLRDGHYVLKGLT